MFVVCVMNLEAGIVNSSAKSFQFDKSAMIQQKIKKAQACINSGQFATAETLLRGVLKLAPGNRHAKALLVSCEEGVKKQKMKELQAYNDACSQATPFALQSFISKYPKSEKVNDAKNRLQDYKLWHVASSKNTLDAYNDYLSKSALKAYQNEAYIAINKLSEEKEWNNCKDGTNEDKLSAFIIRKTKCFRPAKRNVQKAKRNVFVLDTLPNHIKIALERLSCLILTLFLYLLICVYPITTSRLSISANFKPQSLAALKSSFSSTSSIDTSTSALARSEKYFSVFCF